ncbi:tetratricopeptide repeat protein [Saccharospirillum impatiens]|uniref:tetratricopeptide repeat protein n=1 Tax=Saccharospirillum impatiens TaxID=169438 RepID=UPI0003FE6F54|nr:tetratricopeptide repeat protein [Saccharospirillum impatiens]
MTSTAPFRHNLLATLMLSLALSGCSTTASQVDSSDNAEPQASSPGSESASSENRIAATPLTGESFYTLLLAEIATNRGDFASAAQLYSRLDRQYDDLEVAQRATALNQVIGNYDAMGEHAGHWLRLEPNSAEGWQALTIASLANADQVTAGRALNQWLTLDPNAEVDGALAGINALTGDEQARLLPVLAEAEASHPNNTSIGFANAQLLSTLGQYEQALDTLTANRAQQDSPDKGLLEFRLLLELNNIEQARTAISDLADRYPNNSQVATTYAGFAYADSDTNKTATLESLFNRFPNEPVIARAFARESFDNEDYDTAEVLFERLIPTEYSDEAHYFLGRISRINRVPEEAAQRFLSVQAPPYIVSALAELSEVWQTRPAEVQQALHQARQTYPAQSPVLWRIEADLFRRLGEPDQAMAIYGQALSAHPGDTSLLYDQALLAANQGQYELLEANLTDVLEREPDNASALNALGYTWADRNVNLAQAQRYIDRALEQQPDDPAIQDSKGWVEYRLGNLIEAERWLRRSLESMESDEVAAHLAAALWAQGKQEEAQRWLDQAFDWNSDSPTARAIIETLGIDR